MTASLNLRTLEQQESETLETYADQVLGAVMIGYAGFSESHWNRMAIEAFILGYSCHEAKRIVLNKNLVHWISNHSGFRSSDVVTPKHIDATEAFLALEELDVLLCAGDRDMFDELVQFRRRYRDANAAPCGLDELADRFPQTD